MKNFKLKIFILVLLMFCVSNVKAMTIDKDTKLTEDINDIVIVNGKTVEIDLNGHKITYASQPKKNEPALLATNGAVVTIKGEGTIESTNYNGITISEGSKVILKSGNVKAVEFGVLVAKNSTFTMDGGTITTIDNCGVGGNGSSGYEDYTININGGVINANIKTAGYVSCGIYHPNRGTVNISGGVINSSNGAGIVQRAGTLNITGGTINTEEKTKDITGKVGDSRVVVPASAIVVDKEANYPQTATINAKITGDVVINSVQDNIKIIGTGIEVKAEGGVFKDEPKSTEIADGYVAKKVIAGANENKYVIVKESELKLQVINGIISKDSVSDDEVQLIDKEIKGKYTLAAYYDVLLVKLTKNNDIVEYVSEAENKVKVTLGIPEGLPKVKEGYIRKYYVVRIHNGKTTLIDDVTDNGDGTVSFMSDKFSTYALAYTDVLNSSNPATSDNLVLYMILLSFSIISLISVIIYKKKLLIK